MTGLEGKWKGPKENREKRDANQVTGTSHANFSSARLLMESCFQIFRLPSDMTRLLWYALVRQPLLFPPTIGGWQQEQQ